MLFPGIHAIAQMQVPFTSDQWTYTEREPRQLEQINGREALYLNGQASLEKVAFQDGVLEVDFMAQKPRAFAGLHFRAQGPGDNETFYVRLHKSSYPDAIQYNPEFNGESNWQLYREHQAVVAFNPNEWNHLKLEFRGSILKAFLNDQPEPILVVAQLRRDDPVGFIGFYSFLGAYFSNFRYTPFPDTVPLKAPGKAESPVIAQWELSRSFAGPEMEVQQYPKDLEMAWETVTAEPSGLLPISKYRRKTSSGNFEDNPVSTVWARHTFITSASEVKKFSFDFSDDAVVYFNGTKLFEGKNGFRAKGPTFRGDMLIDGNTLFLQTREGENEILIAVSDRANGWGVMGKIE